MNTQERTVPYAVIVLVAIAIGAIVVAASLGAFSSTTQATHEDPIRQEGNPSCSNFQGNQTWTELKIQNTDPFNWDGLNGTFDDGTLSVEITGITDAFEPPFDWSSNIGVDAVFVKGGPEGNLYLYDPEDTSDTGLTTTINQNNQLPYDISHISFCYDEGEATPTPTPGTTPTPTPTPGAEASPTPTPTALAEVQQPEALPTTGGAPDQGTSASLALLLGLGGLALLSGAGTLVAVKVRRQR